MKTLNLVVLVSGRGSNLQAIIDSIESGMLTAKILCVISDRPDAYGLKRAQDHGIETIVVDYKKIKEAAHGNAQLQYETQLLDVLKKYTPDLICLAGYMRIIGPKIISAFRGRIINIHPALLPSFPGLNAQKQALDHGATISGCTVHFVDEGCDTGPVILQRLVPVLKDDTEDTLSSRILEQEHIAYPEAIKLIAQGKVCIEGGKVKILKEGK
ncbi:MAG: phosphoribosylglycinamide formyltransferase [Candidatus Margulisiibacteriota bacterium]